MSSDHASRYSRSASAVYRDRAKRSKQVRAAERVDHATDFVASVVGKDVVDVVEDTLRSMGLAEVGGGEESVDGTVTLADYTVQTYTVADETATLDEYTLGTLEGDTLDGDTLDGTLDDCGDTLDGDTLDGDTLDGYTLDGGETYGTYEEDESTLGGSTAVSSQQQHLAERKALSGGGARKAAGMASDTAASSQQQRLAERKALSGGGARKAAGMASDSSLVEKGTEVVLSPASVLSFDSNEDVGDNESRDEPLEKQGGDHQRGGKHHKPSIFKLKRLWKASKRKVAHNEMAIIAEGNAEEGSGNTDGDDGGDEGRPSQSPRNCRPIFEDVELSPEATPVFAREADVESIKTGATPGDDGGGLTEAHVHASLIQSAMAEAQDLGRNCSAASSGAQSIEEHRGSNGDDSDGVEHASTHAVGMNQSSAHAVTKSSSAIKAGRATIEGIALSFSNDAMDRRIGSGESASPSSAPFSTEGLVQLPSNVSSVTGNDEPSVASKDSAKADKAAAAAGGAMLAGILCHAQKCPSNDESQVLQLTLDDSRASAALEGDNGNGGFSRNSSLMEGASGSDGRANDLVRARSGDNTLSPSVTTIQTESDRDYDVNPTKLHLYLHDGLWDKAAGRCVANAFEARTWVFRRQTAGAEHAHARVIEHEDDSGAEKKVRWRMLPLHASVQLGAPPSTVLAILRAYPEAAEMTDDMGMLPIHLAVRRLRNASKDDVDEEERTRCMGAVQVLLTAYPGGADFRDGKGRTPLDLAGAVQPRWRKEECEMAIRRASAFATLNKANSAEEEEKKNREELEEEENTIGQGEDGKAEGAGCEENETPRELAPTEGEMGRATADSLVPSSSPVGDGMEGDMVDETVHLPSTLHPPIPLAPSASVGNISRAASAEVSTSNTSRASRAGNSTASASRANSAAMASMSPSAISGVEISRSAVKPPRASPLRFGRKSPAVFEDVVIPDARTRIASLLDDVYGPADSDETAKLRVKRSLDSFQGRETLLIEALERKKAASAATASVLPEQEKNRRPPAIPTSAGSREAPKTVTSKRSKSVRNAFGKGKTSKNLSKISGLFKSQKKKVAIGAVATTASVTAVAAAQAPDEGNDESRSRRSPSTKESPDGSVADDAADAGHAEPVEEEEVPPPAASSLSPLTPIKDGAAPAVAPGGEETKPIAQHSDTATPETVRSRDSHSSSDDEDDGNDDDDDESSTNGSAVDLEVVVHLDSRVESTLSGASSTYDTRATLDESLRSSPVLEAVSEAGSEHDHDDDDEQFEVEWNGFDGKVDRVLMRDEVVELIASEECEVAFEVEPDSARLLTKQISNYNDVTKIEESFSC